MLDEPDTILPIGDATSRLIAAVVERPGVRHVLHLEDDWEAEPSDPAWLKAARGLLDAQPAIGQVRLRHSEEPVLPYHMLTRRPIRWSHQGAFRLSPEAHFTFNPSLLRAADVRRIFPCHSEFEAQRQFLRARFSTAQLVPGVFRHIGKDRSHRLAVEALRRELNPC